MGLLYAFLYTKLGVPSFVFSLAGLLAFQGVLLCVLGTDGTINLPSDSWLRSSRGSSSSPGRRRTCWWS